MKDIFGDEITIELLQAEITDLAFSKRNLSRKMLTLESELKSLAKLILVKKYKYFDDEVRYITTNEALEIIKKEIN